MPFAPKVCLVLNIVQKGGEGGAAAAAKNCRNFCLISKAFWQHKIGIKTLPSTLKTF